ncbi:MULTISPECIES: CPBP family intramembrane glutamic endopeptidase [unclassified Modestobacter]|uniref:CPBP family intramembrane glutamic endopeptidase n=1 Tax=unclassified Modestobacter TaxID=2643866 RepID=UPI0022AA95DA|nr:MULTISPECIES: CPBP family intramembrane glutamic endopeptidase [unclassified Modestobacter]MCZ2826143.1 CPBP family intramembrane metalloprotease [Modestobacter sp. VKM Ac-2981]MCZ2852792.1 CPBP family intramembrane metalloprotease [Modestobacter sp. VKM Ac-2982]
MHVRPAGRRGALLFAASVAVLLAAWNNVVITRTPGYPQSYVPVNLAATGLLLVGARSVGFTWKELGLDPRRARAGLRWGGACSAVVAAGYAAGLAVQGVRPLLADARLAGASSAEVAYQALVRIPLGTVVWEETAFRGVLLAALMRTVPPRAAIAVSAALFGIWHIRPTLSAATANTLTDGSAGLVVAVLLGCAFTAAAGVLFAWLRLRSGSLLAPALLHLATNSLGALAATAAHRLG